MFDPITLKGWLPVDAVVVDGRPGLQWLDMTGVLLSEPFFQQTVDRVRSGDNHRELFTEFDVLVQLEKTLETVPPSGFIFHSSRCGSTLLANACRSINGALVLSEPYAVDKLLARFLTDVGDTPVKETLYSIFLRGVVHALGQRRTGADRYLFLKFSCCSLALIDRIRRIWPDVPAVFIYRDPIETIVSNMNDVPAWLIDEDHRVLAAIIGVSPDALATMSLEERCARTIANLYSRALDDDFQLINYNESSLSVVSSVLRFFNVTPSTEELETIARAFGVHAKDASGTRPFTADAEKKQKLASSLVREMAAAWANEPYQQLEQKRLRTKLTIGAQS